MRETKRILLATDGSDSCVDAELEAARLAGETGAELVVAYVWEPAVVQEDGGWRLETLEELYARTDRPFARALEAADAEHVAATVEIRQGAPEQEIPRIAERLDVDLVVLGARRQHPFARLLFGSVSHSVLNQLRRPLIVVNEGSRTGAATEHVPTG